MSATNHVAFDVRGPLPNGTTILKASAGTGKTSTIAALATRYIAEGHANISELLLVTFGRAATSELRERVRRRLVDTAAALADHDAARTHPDPLVAALAGTDNAELSRRHARLVTALAGFDAAPITTTHGFCRRALRALGISADLDPDAILLPDQADLLQEVTDDLYVRCYGDHRGRPDDGPFLTPAQAGDVARAAVGDPTALLGPTSAAADTIAGHLVAFATAARAETARRKRARRLLDYDDLLILLRDALIDPGHGRDAAARVRDGIRAVLVDEFQDTDPIQWEILRRAFHGHVPLVLIGDPKQAIYAFRGGDVVAYLAAAQEADAQAGLLHNWRSHGGLIAGLAHLWQGVALGDPRIVVGPVSAARPRAHVVDEAPLRIRQLTRPALSWTDKKLPPVTRVRETIVADVTAEAVRTLVDGRLGDDTGMPPRPLLPQDIAVLTRRNADALAVRDALTEAGVPAVVSGLTSVFASPAARHWLTLLQALERPGDPRTVAALALTPFVGWDVHRLATAPDSEHDRLTRRVREWSRLLTERGVAALGEAVAADGPAVRLAATTNGERMFTDLRHVCQELHAAAREGGLGVSALADWLRRRQREAADDYTEERSRRLDTDAAAVQVVTVHAAKGLEFPVVFVPFAWDRYESDSQPVLRLHDAQGHRLLHVGGPQSPGVDEARAAHLAEERGEDLRLLYVALTRACSQVVLWWAPTRNAASGAASRLLFGERAPSGLPQDRIRIPSDDEAAATLHALTGRSAGTIRHEQVTQPPATPRLAPELPATPVLELAVLDRGFDTTWRRTSYSSITALAHEATYGLSGEGPLSAGVVSEPESAATDDEAAGALVAGGHPATTDHETVPPMADLPAGTAFGTLVHDVLEHVDTAAGDLADELRRRCRAAGADRVPGLGADTLAAALEPVMRTPLGPVVDDRCLADVMPADRRPELEFEFPLAGGDTDPVRDGCDVTAIAGLLRRHLPAGDPLAAYADHLDGAPFAHTRLRGYLTGSIDAVLRVPGEGGPRFVVVDYKTNRLAPVGARLTTAHYAPSRLAEAMIKADYPLQLLLYLVAVHRFLRWRLADYDPQRHLGGGLYLFVRGMSGPSTPRTEGIPAGVFGWCPPAQLVVDLSALLEGATA